MQLYISLKKLFVCCDVRNKKNIAESYSGPLLKSFQPKLILNEYKQCQGPQHICSLKYVRKKVQAIHYSV